MAAEGTVLCQVRVTGLGAEVDTRKKFTVSAAPTGVQHGVGICSTANSIVILPLGQIDNSKIDGVWFRAIGGNFWIDPALSAANTGIHKLRVADSTCAYFQPGDSVAVSRVVSIGVMASTAGTTFEYTIVGRTS